MSKIGNLKSKTVNGRDVYSGSICTLEHSIIITMRPISGKASDNAPSHEISTMNKDGIETEIGAAWEKQFSRGTNPGEKFFSITIDDPSFNRPLNVAAFKNGQTGDWDIMYRRRQERAA